MVRLTQTARGHSRALRQSRPGAISGPGRRGLSRADCGGRRGVAAYFLYRHFRSSTICCLPTTTPGLHWFRAALDARPTDESIIDSVQAAIFSFPYDVDAVTKIASLRRGWSRAGSIHAICARWKPTSPIQAQLRRRNCDMRVHPMRLHRRHRTMCGVAMAVFGAMEA